MTSDKASRQPPFYTGNLKVRLSDDIVQRLRPASGRHCVLSNHFYFSAVNMYFKCNFYCKLVSAANRCRCCTRQCGVNKKKGWVTCTIPDDCGRRFSSFVCCH